MVPGVSVLNFPGTLVWDNTGLPLRYRSSRKAFSATKTFRDKLGKCLGAHPHCHTEREGLLKRSSACRTREGKSQKRRMASSDLQRRKLPENSGRPCVWLQSVMDL